jgi:coenzyme F420-reducing hydrogenase delta subunit
VKLARNLIGEVGMDSGRLDVIEGYNLSAAKYMSIAEEHASAVKSLGENPMKMVAVA